MNIQIPFFFIKWKPPINEMRNLMMHNDLILSIFSSLLYTVLTYEQAIN